MREEQPKEPWHLKKEIQVGQIITLLAMIGSVAVYVNKMDQRLLVLEERQQAQRENSAIANTELQRRFDRFQLQLDRIEQQQTQFIRGVK